MNSTVLFFVLVCCAVALADVQSDWMENSKICSQKNNVSLEDLKKVMTGEMKPTDVPQNMKCHFLCMAEKEGIIKDGHFQAQALTEKMTSVANKEELAKTIAACKDLKGSDNCDTAFKIMICMSQAKRV